jgi:FG-GAP-like repeat
LVTEASTIGVLKGNGDGTFAITKQYSFDPASGVANGSFTAVTGDFNHDGKTDFA